MKLFVVDVETTGLSARENEIIEYAGILLDVDTRGVIAQMSCLHPCETNNAEFVNKISADLSMKTDLGVAMKATALFESLLDSCDYIIAHNARFDKSFVDEHFNYDNKNNWVCSLRDIKWPGYKAGKLINMAVDFGVPVLSAHRALTDCELLAKIFQKTENLRELIEGAVW